MSGPFRNPKETASSARPVVVLSTPEDHVTPFDQHPPQWMVLMQEMNPTTVALLQEHRSTQAAHHHGCPDHPALLIRSTLQDLPMKADRPCN